MKDDIQFETRPIPARVVVIGGGIAGLAATYRLTRLDSAIEVTLVEARDRLGGTVLTERIDGFVIEGGPDSFLSSKPRGVGLCEELGLGDRLIGTTPRGHRAFVLRRGRLHDLPDGLTGLVPTRLGPLFRSSLVSPAGKVRFALDYVLPPRRGEGDESLAAFVRRRLGRGVYDCLVEPLMAGIYAGDGERLSLAATFPQLRRAELGHGGLIKGVVAARREASAAGRGTRPAFVAPAGGMGDVIEALVGRLGEAGVRLRTGTAVVGLAADESGYGVVLADGETLPTDAVIVAVPAHVAGGLVGPLDGRLGEALGAVPHASSAIVTLAYRREDVPHPLDGYGYVVPRVEGRPVLACTWSSSKWPARAPHGFSLLRVFIGRFGQEEVLAGADEDLIALARTELRSTLGVVAPPALYRVHRWRSAMPQYTLGHLDRVATIERRLERLPGLVLAGSGYRGVGIPDCIASGEAAAEAVRAYLETTFHGRRGARSGGADVVRAG